MLILYLAVIAVTFYVGGIYRDLPVTVLFISEGIMLLLLMAQTITARRKIECFFKKSTTYAIKNTPAKKEALFKNNSRFTLSRLSCRIKSFYAENDKAKAKKYKLFLPSGAEKSICADVSGKYCGILKTRIYNVKIKDCFGITGAGTRAFAEGNTVILPSEKPLKFIKRANPSDYDREVTESLMHSGTDSHEVHQLRLYRYGDPVKNIHRNLSARTDEIYYKEYKAAESSSARLFVDIKGNREADIEKADVFYELCSSVILGIFDCLGAVEVQWYNGNKREKMTLREKAGIRNILARLYVCKTDKNADASGMNKAENCFMFNTSLELYADKKHIFTFSHEDWEEQIKTEEFII